MYKKNLEFEQFLLKKLQKLNKEDRFFTSHTHRAYPQQSGKRKSRKRQRNSKTQKPRLMLFQAQAELFIYTPLNKMNFYLFACFGDIAKSLLTLFSNVSPVFCSHLVFREEFGAHAHTENTRLNPRGQIFLSRLYSAGNHQL